MPALIDEMQNYLETVALFRTEGYSPHWAAEEPEPMHSLEELGAEQLLVGE
jgi:hypothetical protein